MKKILIIAAGLILALALSFATAPVKAEPLLDFGIIAPTGGSIYYNGGSTPLYGTGIDVDNVTGIGTPLNSGVTVPLTGYFLDFTTGNLASSDSSHWYFGPGGSITISNGTTNLLTGTFTNVPNVQVMGNTYTVTAEFFDTKDLDWLAFFGLPNTTYSGGLNGLDFYASGLPPPGAFTSRELLSVNLTNTLIPVPEPATMLLLGSGLIGLVGYGRRFLKK